VAEDPLGIVGLPGVARLAGGVVLVEADQQVHQLTPDRLDPQQRGKLRERLMSQSAYQLAQSSSAPSTIRKTR
jgi:hypothetical protein